MSINDELLMKLYPEWYRENNTVLIIAVIFILVFIFLMLGYIFEKLENMYEDSKMTKEDNISHDET